LIAVAGLDFGGGVGDGDEVELQEEAKVSSMRERAPPPLLLHLLVAFSCSAAHLSAACPTTKLLFIHIHILRTHPFSLSFYLAFWQNHSHADEAHPATISTQR